MIYSVIWGIYIYIYLIWSQYRHWCLTAIYLRCRAGVWWLLEVRGKIRKALGAFFRKKTKPVCLSCGFIENVQSWLTRMELNRWELSHVLLLLWNKGGWDSAKPNFRKSLGNPVFKIKYSAYHHMSVIVNNMGVGVDFCSSTCWIIFVTFSLFSADA